MYVPDDVPPGQVDVIAGAALTLAASVPVAGPGSDAVVDETNDEAYVAVGGAGPGAVSVIGPTVGYNVTFAERGLPNGSQWFVNLTGGALYNSTTNRTGFAEPNGTYSYSIASADPCFQSSGGTFTLNGSAVGVSVVFTTAEYTVTFQETGLPTQGRQWSVAFDGILKTTAGTIHTPTVTTLSFAVPIGTWAFLVTGPVGFPVALAAAYGTITVNGASVFHTVTFVRGPTDVLTFHEVGLARGTTWCVTVAAAVCSTTPRIVLKNVTPESYGYAIKSFGGMTTLVKIGSSAVSASGTVYVGHSLTFQVRYAYGVTFTQHGLFGASWTVSMGGMTVSSTTTSLVINLTNGTYGFSVHTVSGYTRLPASGRLTLAGGPLSVGVIFTPTRGHVPAAIGAEVLATEVARVG